MTSVRRGASGAGRASRPSVAAAVVTYNHRDAVLELLTFLDARGIPTFVTENACADGTREAIRGRFRHVSLLASDANLGGCGGFDCAVLAALSAGTDYVLLIDDDALPLDDCIEQLAAFLDEHPDYVFAAPAVYIASRPGTLQEAGGSVDFRCDRPVEAWHRFEVEPRLPPRLDVHYASACCLMVRADAVLRLGVMDWSYFIFSDDVDWCVRLRRAFGKRAACVTTARVLHDFPWAKPFSPMRLYFFQRNGLYFLARLREGDASRRVLRLAVFNLLRRALYAWMIGDRETAATLRGALVDALRGRTGAWSAPVRFPGERRRRLDAAYFRRHAIRRVLVDISIEDVDAAAVRAIRELGGDDVVVDVLCDHHRVGPYREKALFAQVEGRSPGFLGPIRDAWRVGRRRYDLTVTDAWMEPRRPSSTSGRRAALFHDGALYEAAAVGPWSCVAHVGAGMLAAPAAEWLHRRLLVPPPPGRPPREAQPLLERLGVRPDVGQPWARDWRVPFPVPRADEAAVLRVPAPHVDATAPTWIPLHPPPPGTDGSDYDTWRRARARSVATTYGTRPPDVSFSVIVTVDERSARWLDPCVASVRAQTHAGWQLLLADHAGLRPGLRARLAAAAAADARIALAAGDAAARGARLATGDYLVFLDAADLLDVHALAAFALASREGRVDLLYADEDRVDADGRHAAPDFKPDFSPARLRAADYIGRPVAVRRDLVERLGSLRGEGATERDLVLRAAEAAGEVVHVPDVLYHARLDDDAAGVGRRVRLAASGRGARDGSGAIAVSVLVLREDATGEQELLARWAGAECLLAEAGSEPAARVLGALAARASGQVLLVTSSRVRPADGWSDVLAPAVLDAQIGLATGKLTCGDDRLHSAGLVLGIAGAVGRWHHGAAASEDGHGGWIALPHEISAVPWQLMAVRRDLFLAEGGFDPSFGHRGFDTDLALRLGSRGLRHLYLPDAAAAFVGGCPDPGLEGWRLEDLTLLWERWGRVIRSGDPYLNVNLSLLSETMALATQTESDLRARGGLMAYDACTVERLARRFPGRLVGPQPSPSAAVPGPVALVPAAMDLEKPIW